MANVIAIFWGGYYISFPELGRILTEPFSLFLITLYLYLFVQSKKNNALKFTIGSGIVLGYLALTKIIFGYVVLAMLLVTTFLYTFQKKNTTSRNLVGVLIIAFLMNCPYLAYTYSLTGKYLYWGNSGGLSLYWMSTPHQNEYGDWNHPTFTAYCQNPNIPCNADLLAKNHQKDIDYILSLPKIEQDDAYKNIALRNIHEHPLKYLQNVVANVSRLFFGIPFSYYPQQPWTFLRFPPNALLFSMMVLSLVLWLVNFRKTPVEVSFLVFLSLTYLGGTSLLSAYPRMLSIVVPMILFWCGYILSRNISIEWISSQ